MDLHFVEKLFIYSDIRRLHLVLEIIPRFEARIKYVETKNSKEVKQ